MADNKLTIDKRTTIIDQQTGEIEKRVEGKIKGFAEGFKNYVAQGPKHAEVEMTFDVGQFPATHPKYAGKFGVHVTIYPFDEQMDAEAIADRAAVLLKGKLGGLS